MNKTLLTLAVAAVATLSAAGNVAYAAEADGNQWLDAATATKTRAEVAAELKQARADGVVGFAGTSYPWLARAKSLTSREAVKADFRAARDAHALPLVGEGFDGTVAATPARRGVGATTVAAK